MAEGGRAKEGQNDWVRPPYGRVCLWDKQSANKEWVRREFHNPCFTSLICSGYFQPCLCQLLLVCRIESEIAVVSFSRPALSIYVGGLRPRIHAHFHGFSHKGATQRSDKQAGCVRVGLRVCGLANSHHISRIFEHQMLRAAARAEKGNFLLSRVLDAEQRAFKAPVRAARAAEQSLIFAEFLSLVRG